MSVLAGFDVVTEISRKTIEQLVKQNPDFPLLPPFEVPISFPGGAGHLLIDEVQVDLDGNNDSLIIRLIMSKSSAATTIGALVVCPIGGAIVLSVPLTLTRFVGQWHIIRADLGRATASLQLTPESEAAVLSDLSGTGISIEQFRSAVQDAVTSHVQAAGSIALPNEFAIVQDGDGSLNPMVYTSLQVHCIGNVDRNKQVLAILGNVLQSTKSNGDYKTKTSLAITSGNDVATSISPYAFRALVFCPAVHKALGQPANLPPICGTAIRGVSTRNIVITNLTDTFIPGFVAIKGSAQKNGLCYTSSATFRVTIGFEIDGGNMKTNIEVDEPDVEADVEWYCQLPLALLGPLGVYGLGVIAIVEEIAEEIFERLGKGFLENLLRAFGGDLNPVGFEDIVLSIVQVHSDRLTIQGELPIAPVDIAAAVRDLYLVKFVTPISRTVFGSGTAMLEVPCGKGGARKEYPYTEYAQTQRSTHTLNYHLLPEPLTVQWTVREPRSNTAYPLTARSGTLTIQEVECQYAVPLGSGGTTVTQPVHLDYEVDGIEVNFRNRAAEGNYWVRLEALVRDCAGDPPQDVDDIVNGPILMTGNTVEVGGDFVQEVERCNKQRLKAFSKWRYLDEHPPHMVFERFRALYRDGAPGVETVLLQNRIVLGEDFSRASNGPSYTRFGVDPAGRRVAAEFRNRAVRLRKQISVLLRELDRVQGPALRSDPRRGDRLQ